MTNLRCTADHYAVTPLNIRPGESGIIPDHFSTMIPTIFQPVEKTYPAHHDLSERAGPTPAVFLTNIRIPDQGPLIADLSIFPERGWSALWCERAFIGSGL